ncbi:hypothetical protein OEZ85_012238 [Tetradesmus obliquus]|uniref:Uncharacterized protein n=1 Tax=Tetradesmus obliquus TaxID=3088 RepID=A0ABY8TWQ2_TETOB|nr:hypothetical protein OEZ85_012238 [Tetradesmus obliquus]
MLRRDCPQAEANTAAEISGDQTSSWTSDELEDDGTTAPPSPESSGHGDLEPMQCSLLLALQPDHLEVEWENSELAARLFTLCDGFACSHSILVNSVLLLWNLRTNVWQHWLKALLVLYICASVCQLAVLTQQPRQYLRRRTMINIVNRLLRVLMLLGKLLSLSPAVVHGMAAEAASTGILSQRDGSSAWHNALTVARPILSPLLVYAAHANFLLPFRYVLPLQLVTLGISLKMARLLACWYVTTPAMQHLTVWACGHMHRVMHVAKLLYPGIRGPWEPNDGEACSSTTTAATLLLLYANVVTVLVLPCLLVYQLEWSQKDKFVRQSKQRRLSRPWPDSLLMVAVVMYSALAASWYACAFVVSMLSLVCDGGELALAEA